MTVAYGASPEKPGSRHQPCGPAKLAHLLGVPRLAHIWSIRNSHELRVSCDAIKACSICMNRWEAGVLQWPSS